MGFPLIFNPKSWRDGIHRSSGMFHHDISVPFLRSLTWTGENLRSELPDRGRRHLRVSTCPLSEIHLSADFARTRYVDINCATVPLPPLSYPNPSIILHAPQRTVPFPSFPSNLSVVYCTYV